VQTASDRLGQKYTESLNRLICWNSEWFIQLGNNKTWSSIGANCRAFIVHACVHKYIHTYVCMYVCMYACMYVAMYLPSVVLGPTAGFLLFMRAYINIYIHTYVCSYVPSFCCVCKLQVPSVLSPCTTTVAMSHILAIIQSNALSRLSVSHSGTPHPTAISFLRFSYHNCQCVART
jgi:hypothetical protein